VKEKEEDENRHQGEKGFFRQGSGQKGDEKIQEGLRVFLFQVDMEEVEGGSGQEIGQVVVGNGGGDETEHGGVREKDDEKEMNEGVGGYHADPSIPRQYSQNRQKDVEKTEIHQVGEGENVQRKHLPHEEIIKIRNVGRRTENRAGIPVSGKKKSLGINTTQSEVKIFIRGDGVGNMGGEIEEAQREIEKGKEDQDGNKLFP